jgi:hypothetical protein
MSAFPDDTVQGLVGAWWHKASTTEIRRGRLVWAFTAHVDQQPYELVLEGRSSPTSHADCVYRMQQLDLSAPVRAPALPIAGLPHYPGERRVVYRGKRRPMLVVSTGGHDVPPALRQGTGKAQSGPTLLVAPYYGVDQDGSRAGWRPDFVERIRACEYPQYVWDQLPLDGRTSASILRLDHICPIGRHYRAYQLTDYELCPDALAVVDEWITWLVTGALGAASFLRDVREALMSPASGGGGQTVGSSA